MTKRIASASSDRDQPTLNPNDQPQGKPNPSKHRAGMPSRRDFIKDCAAAAVGSGLAVAGGAALATSSADAVPPTDDATVPLKKVIARPDLWFYPGEPLDPNEMRVTLMGTGCGSIIGPASQPVLISASPMPSRSRSSTTAKIPASPIRPTE